MRDRPGAGSQAKICEIDCKTAYEAFKKEDKTVRFVVALRGRQDWDSKHWQARKSRVREPWDVEGSQGGTHVSVLKAFSEKGVQARESERCKS